MGALCSRKENRRSLEEDPVNGRDCAFPAGASVPKPAMAIDKETTRSISMKFSPILRLENGRSNRPEKDKSLALRIAPGGLSCLSQREHNSRHLRR